MKLRKYLFDIASSGVPTVVVKLRGLVVLPFLVHTVGLAGYGAWMQVVATTNLLALLASLGLHSAIIRFYPDQEGRAGRAALLYSSLALSVGAAAVLCAGYAIFSPQLSLVLLHAPGYGPLLALGSLLIPLGVLRLMMMSHFRAQDRISWISAADSVFGVLEIALLVGSAVTFRSVYVVMAASVAALALYQAVLLGVALHEGFRPAFAWERIGEYLRYAVPLIPSMGADEVLSRGDRLLVGLFMGADAVGLYSAIYALASLPMMISTPVNNALMPKVVESWCNGDRRGAGTYVGGTVQAMAVLVTAAAAFLAVTGTPLLRLLGAAGAVFLPSGLLVLVGVGSYALARVYAVVFVARKETGTFSLMWVSAGAVNVVLNLLFIPWLGIAGAALATAVTYLLLLSTTHRATRDMVVYVPFSSMRARMTALLRTRNRATS